MKRFGIMTAALALVLGMAQCRKPVETINAEPTGETVEVTLRVANGAGKTEITSTGVVTWKAGDRLYVVGETDGLLGSLSAQSAGDPVVFSGSIDALTEAQTLKFYYVGDRGFTLDDSGDYTFSIGAQDGSLAGIAANNQLMWGKIDDVAVGTTDLGTISMTSLIAIAHLNINDGGSPVSGSVTVTGGKASATFNAKTYDGSALSGMEVNITMTFVSPTTSTDCYIALLPGAQTLKFSADGKEATLGEKNVEANKFYNSGTAIAVTVTAPSYLPGEFTINSDGTKVKFSKGNLYWDGGAFRFEANQWSFESSWNSNHVSHFYWSKTASVAYASSYSDGSAAVNDVFFTNSSSFQVAGETAGTWRTLGRGEWDYLLNTRTGATSLCAWKELDSGAHYGLVILPDGTENPSTVMGRITSTDDLETYDAVFLPAAGNRSGTDVKDVGSGGNYWSSSPRGDAEAFYNWGSVLSAHCDRSNGLAVRLVCE